MSLLLCVTGFEIGRCFLPVVAGRLFRHFRIYLYLDTIVCLHLLLLLLAATATDDHRSVRQRDFRP